MDTLNRYLQKTNKLTLRNLNIKSNQLLLSHKAQTPYQKAPNTERTWKQKKTGGHKI